MAMLEAFCGNSRLKEALALKLRDGRLPHAVLLEGPRGCGKRTFARLIAAAQVCTGTPQPCGQCAGCRKVLSGAHPDVIVLGEGGPLKVDDIRALRTGAYVLPNEAPCKVYILCDVHRMTPQAQNALLKVLEEPPASVRFVLTCTDASALLPTTLSRVMRWKVEPLSVEACTQELMRRLPQQDEARCRRAAEAFGGCLGQALESLQGEELPPFIAAADELVEALGARREFEMLRVFGQFETDRDGLARLLQRTEELLHRALAARYTAGTGGALSAQQYCRALDVIAQGRRYLEQNMGYPLLSAWLCAGLRRAVEQIERTGGRLWQR